VGVVHATQRYILTIVAVDGGGTPLSSTASVTIHVVDDDTLLPPEWQLVRGQTIDDFTGITVSEDTAVNTLITNMTSIRLVATSRLGQVEYHLSNNGPPELNGDRAFHIPSPNPLNDSSVMPIATGGKFDASVVPSYVLRCRAFVSEHLLHFICLRRLDLGYSIIIQLYCVCILFFQWWNFKYWAPCRNSKYGLSIGMQPVGHTLYSLL